MKKIVCIFYLVIANLFCFGQASIVPSDFPKEEIFVHHNATFFLTGETLFYKVYCLNPKTKALSKLSKIAYVELISSEGKPVLKQKVILYSGESYGDFFLPSSLESGNYKLIAYTQWMRNENAFYENDILLVNPLKANQFKREETINSIKEKGVQNMVGTPNESEYLNISFDKNSYKTRSKVALNIKSVLKEQSYGSYSLSVTKKIPIEIPRSKTSQDYTNRDRTRLDGNNIFIPELRGELIEGSVTDAITNKPVSDVSVYMSVSGFNHFFKVTNTNSNGNFYFNVDEDYQNTLAQFDFFNSGKKGLKLHVKKKLPLDYKQLNYNDLYVKEKDADYILKKNIHIQIENSFKSLYKNKFREEKVNKPFYGTLAEEYVLDDFKRFATLKQTFIEVIDYAWISVKDGNHNFEIRKDEGGINYKFPALLIVDGILIKNHNDIIDYSAHNIEKISVLRNQYVYGPLIFDGAIIIETKKRDFRHNVSKSGVSLELIKPNLIKEYFWKDYTSKEDYTRIPDYRYQLFWLPNLKIDKENTSLEFYTSDLPGNYEITLEGFTNSGRAISIKKSISVE